MSRRNHALAAFVTGLLVVTGVSAGTASATPAIPGADKQAVAWAGRMLRGMSLEEKVGQLFVADVWGKFADQADPGNQSKYGVDTPAEVVQRYHPGGVIYFNNAGTDNVDDPAQVARLSNGLQRAALSSGAHVPLIVSIDQEGGRVTRIAAPATEYPASMAVGAGRSVEDARQLATINGRELRAMGINQDFAPDADVNSNPLNPIIGSRSFSADPALTGQLVAAEVAGYQDSGPATQTVSSAAKHFPGHGDAATDSHTGLPVISRTEQQWRDIDLPPFQAAIKAGIDVIMTAHITVPSLDPSGEPATLSKPIMTGILRNELGYDGVVVTDSLQMAGVRQMHPDSEIPVLALEAGVDQMLMPPDLGVAIKGVLDAVKSGRLTEQRIDQSVLRILELKFKRGILAEPLVNEQAVNRVVGTPAHLAAIQQLTDRTTTVLRNDAGLLPLKNPGKVLVTGWNNPSYPGYPAEPVATLAKQLGGTAVSTGASPTADQIGQAVAAAQQSDTVVVLTNGLRTSTAQQDLVQGLLATGKPVVAVTIQEPYDPGYADVPTWVATYDWRDVTMRSLAKVLLGQISPQGKLPVSIPAGSDGRTILYPFGTGLTW
ncbi:beta-N-acetylhexosaminidase [Amycolatopsis bartoniae]|uniref:beta-N-acetylhexosaminidase n=1 Tax=Amycolatopsis bartoniae TaxID=941986 RepID=A0A8H9J244_9PSEU|nr:glycoside hydrolase family 3 protein [Amycolatopsis bartoniae]MBB2935177.1 beta-N-acetylhexosaminidase [Amycolatopsis bartoniae]TVS98918.1 glycoside hydrolase family 3 protein [Amycolatopsis bartoniae]GHF74908.1 beta-N-acetylhexosaminidase [Amycolatopsis bartoniae]